MQGRQRFAMLGRITRSTLLITSFVSSICCVSCKGGGAGDVIAALSSQTGNRGSSAASSIDPVLRGPFIASLNPGTDDSVFSSESPPESSDGAPGSPDENSLGPVDFDSMDNVDSNGTNGAVPPEDTNEADEANDDGVPPGETNDGNEESVPPGEPSDTNTNIVPPDETQLVSAGSGELFANLPDLPSDPPDSPSEGDVDPPSFDGETAPGSSDSNTTTSDSSQQSELSSNSSSSSDPGSGFSPPEAGNSGASPSSGGPIHNPEPSSTLLVAVGLGALVLVRISAKRSQSKTG